MPYFSHSTFKMNKFDKKLQVNTEVAFSSFIFAISAVECIRNGRRNLKQRIFIWKNRIQTTEHLTCIMKCREEVEKHFVHGHLYHTNAPHLTCWWQPPCLPVPPRVHWWCRWWPLPPSSCATLHCPPLPAAPSHCLPCWPIRKSVWTCPRTRNHITVGTEIAYNQF